MRFPPWMKTGLWVMLGALVVALVVPATLRTFTDGLKGEFDPEVKAQRAHERQVELTEAQADRQIDALEKRVRSLDKILSGTGTDRVPTAVLLRELPACQFEDGGTQQVCVWDGRKQGNGVGAIVVNLDKGKISFFPQTDGWVVN